ncbi:m25.2 protein [Murid betaherpesvirus 1]|uniref:M25.2 protein n=1 Tax=Murid herpesvirus 1 TaxID=10366 RepID=H2A334_MUHV1|nr:m25.2 protein [Murid betaherpesvirus 1]CCE57355.1 m25.2 protein [Murid betaherpesvirus 1]
MPASSCTSRTTSRSSSRTASLEGTSRYSATCVRASYRRSSRSASATSRGLPGYRRPSASGCPSSSEAYSAPGSRPRGSAGRSDSVPRIFRTGCLRRPWLCPTCERRRRRPPLRPWRPQRRSDTVARKRTRSRTRTRTRIRNGAKGDQTMLAPAAAVSMPESETEMVTVVPARSTLAAKAAAMRKAYAVNRLLALGRAAAEGKLEQWLSARRGERIPLVFPEKCAKYLILCAPGDVDGHECDPDALRALEPAVDRLVVVGFVEGREDAHRDGDDRCIVLVNPSSAVFIYDPAPYGGLYRLANTMIGFVRRGLRRFDSIYRDPCCVEDAIRVKDGHASLPRNADEALAAAERGLACTLQWPEDYDFVFGTPPESSNAVASSLNKEQSPCIDALRLSTFGHFGTAAGLSSTRPRTAVFIGADHAVYAIHHAVSKLLRLAESLDMFYKIGIRRFFHNYRVVPSRCGDDRFFLKAV